MRRILTVPITSAALAFAALILTALTMGPPAMAVDLVLPEIAVQVVDDLTGKPVAGARVELLAGKKNELERVASAPTGVDGWVGFGQQASRDMKFAGIRVAWDVPNKPARSLLYRFKATKGAKVSEGRLAEPGRANGFYVLAGDLAGDCDNLFEMRPNGQRYEITFRRPESYSRCHEAHFRHPNIADIGQRDINGGNLNIYSFSDDVSMGRDFTNKMGPNQPVLQDRLIQNYVTGLIQRIGKASDMPDLDFHVQVIDADVLNAFALPGGYTFVYRGLLEATENEAELVGVLAHEIAHVTGRHGTEGVTSSMAKMLTTMVISGFLAEEITDNPNHRQLIMGAALTGTKFWVVGGTRKREAEADRLGAQYALRAGYDPRGLATFFEKLKNAKGGSASRLDTLMSDHPPDDVRIRNVNEMWNYFLPPTDRELITTSAEYVAMKKHLATLPPPKMAGEHAANALFSSFKAANEDLIWGEFMGYAKEQAEQE